jgi:anti-sigma-K factor RskA
MENLGVDLRISDQEHKMYRELLGAYALDAVTRDEELALSAHLEECDSCRTEVSRLRSVVNALPLTVEEMEPPPSLRASILAAIEQEPNIRQAPTPPPASSTPPPVIDLSKRRSRRQWLPWAAAAALLMVSIGLLGWNLTLRGDDDQERQTIAQQEATIGTLEAEIAASQSEPLTIALQPTSADIAGSAEATYLEDEGVILLSLQDLPELPDDQVYQLWLIGDGEPVPSGVFTAEQDEFAVTGNPVDHPTVAITVEPGPLGVTAPTSAPILIGDFETA